VYILVIRQIKRRWKLGKPIIVNLNRAHEKSHGFNGIASSPFFAAFFLINAGLILLAK
jgi:hypothetical protein